MKTDRYEDEIARPFDPQWETVLLSLKEYLNELAYSLQEQEIACSEIERTRRRNGDALLKYQDAVQAIALDLFRAHLSNPHLEVGIAAGRSSVQRMCAGRYGAPFLSARTFEAALRTMKGFGHILLTTEFWDDPTGQGSRVRRYRAAPKLLEGLCEAGASIVTVRRRKDAEGIILKKTKDRKTGKKVRVPYGNVAFANEARDRLRIINHMLQDHWADLALGDECVRQKLREIAILRKKKAPAHPPDFMARTVYRVFNNRDWEQGGRFNGAWWIGCPSPLRPYILIDGKRTVEVDYSGLHAAMLFAEAGKKIPPDPYSRCLTHTGGAEERKLVKVTFNALLNAHRIEQLSEVDDYSEDLTGRDWNAFKRFIVSSFPTIEHHFGSGVGLRLQRKDSDLAEAVMLRFAEMGYACLPVHDSFIVHHGMQDVLTTTMKAVFKGMFGVANETDFDLGLGEAVEVTGRPIGADVEELLRPTGHEGRLQAFLEMHKKV